MDIKSYASEAGRFVIIGIVATAIHYILYYVLLGAMSHNVAYTTGYVVSFLCNYALSTKYTFRVPFSLKRFIAFSISHVINYIIGIGLLNLFIWIGFSKALALLPALIIAVPINFFLVRYALTHRDTKNDAYLMLLLLVGIGMLWLNMFDVPTLSDDMLYRVKWLSSENDPIETINGLSDLISSQKVHYMTVNGRFIVHFLGQASIVFVPSVVMAVINSALFAVMLHQITRFTRAGNKRLMTAATAVMLLFVVSSGLRTTMLWSIGTANYLWVLVTTLALILYFIKAGSRLFENKDLLMLPLAFIVGWSHEGLSVPVSAAMALWLLVNRFKSKNKAIPWLFIAYMVGTLLCLLSPGIRERATSADITMKARFISAAVNFVSNVRITWLLVIVWLWLWRKDRITLKIHWQRYRFVYTALAVSLLIVLLSGTNLERVAFFTDFIAMLMLLTLLQRKVGKHWQPRLTIISCIVVLLFYVPAYLLRQENSDNWHFMEQQMEQPGKEIISVRNVNNNSFVVDMLRKHYVNPTAEFGFYCSYMGFDANDVNMRCAAHLYGKSRLVFLPEDVVNRINADSTAYSNYELDKSGNLYVWRIDNRKHVSGVTFILNPENVSDLWPHQRLLAYKGDTYELDDFNFEDIEIAGRRYVVFTKPTTNIFRRINRIELSF